MWGLTNSIAQPTRCAPASSWRFPRKRCTASAPTRWTCALWRIFEAKERPHFDPLIVHVPDLAAARRFAAAWPKVAQQLGEAFWPGPMTLVVPKLQGSSSALEGKLIPDLVTAGLPTVAIRVPGHEVARELIRRAGVPVAAPSANRFGGVSPTRAEHVLEELAGRVDVVVDGGPCETGVESHGGVGAGLRCGRRDRW